MGGLRHFVAGSDQSDREPHFLSPREKAKKELCEQQRSTQLGEIQHGGRTSYPGREGGIRVSNIDTNRLF
jgi:hypothetical protein